MRRWALFVAVTLYTPPLTAEERWLYGEIRTRIRQQLEAAELTAEEYEEKLRHYRPGGKGLSSKPRPGLLISQLWDRIVRIDPDFPRYYTSETFSKNILTPGYIFRLELWLVGLIARALKVRPIVLFPVEAPSEPLPGTQLSRRSSAPPSELEVLLGEIAQLVTGFDAAVPDLADGLMQELRNACFKAAYAAQR